MKKSVIVFICTLIVLPLVTAAQDDGSVQVFSGTVIDKEQHKTTKGTPFNVSIAVIYFNFTHFEVIESKAIIKFPDRGYVIKNGTCQVDSLYKICATIDFDHYDYQKWPDRQVYNAKLTIDKRISAVILNRTIANGSLFVKQQTSYFLRLSNPSKQTANNVIFSDNLSNLVTIFLLGGSECDLRGSILSWRGTLSPSARIECHAILEGERVGNEPTSAKVSYETTLNNETKTAGGAITVIDYPIRHSANFSNSSPAIGQHVDFNLSLQASQAVTLSNFIVAFPENVTVVEYLNIDKLTDREYRHWGRFEEGEHYNISFRLFGSHTGIQPFTSTYDILYLDRRQEYILSDSINVSVEHPTIQFVSTILDDEIRQLSILVNNPTRFKYTDVSLSLESDAQLRPSSVQIGDLEALSHYSFKTVGVAGKGLYNVTEMLTYTTTLGEVFEVSKVEEINITTEFTIPDEDILDIPDKTNESSATGSNGTVFPERGRSFRTMGLILGAVGVLFAVGVIIYHKKKSAAKVQVPEQNPIQNIEEAGDELEAARGVFSENKLWEWQLKKKP